MSHHTEKFPGAGVVEAEQIILPLGCSLALTSMPRSDWCFAQLVANEPEPPCTLRGGRDEGIRGRHDSNSNTQRFNNTRNQQRETVRITERKNRSQTQQRIK